MHIPTETTRVQISSSSIPRCPHSVYYPQKFIDLREPNWGCGFCNERAHDGDMNIKRFVMPETGSLRDEPERLFANGAQSSGHCPKCFSRVHSVSEKSSRVWVCADCGTNFNAPRGRQ
jgi:hypothetical protein